MFVKFKNWKIDENNVKNIDFAKYFKVLDPKFCLQARSYEEFSQKEDKGTK